MRTENNGIRFFSFQELGEFCDVKPKKQNQFKQKQKQEKFVSRHLCRSCKQPMTFIGGNIMCCQNPDCKGIEITRRTRDGEKVTTYIPSYDILDDVGEQIASRIFD